MKRQKLVKYILGNGCIFVREGAHHSIFFHPETRRTSTVPRHNEINDFLAKKICKDLGITSPK